MYILNQPAGKPLVWYLQEEQRVAREIAEFNGQEVFFTWIAPPTVIYGRHQQAEVEVNEAYCRAHGIEMVQRQSGGGCVYADGGNLMMSYISPIVHPQEVFAAFLEKVRSGLEALGLPAATTSHNDVLVGGYKVSGAACYALPEATIVHATLMWDVDIAALTEAITPTEAKLQKHGVASVRQRVRNLREVTDPAAIEDIHALARYIEGVFEK